MVFFVPKQVFHIFKSQLFDFHIKVENKKFNLM
ncbi:hypothetical protein IGI42_002795 [Enterococcus sp. AZ109]